MTATPASTPSLTLAQARARLNELREEDFFFQCYTPTLHVGARILEYMGTEPGFTHLMLLGGTLNILEMAPLAATAPDTIDHSPPYIIHEFRLAPRSYGRAMIVDRLGQAAWWIGDPPEKIHPLVADWLRYTGRRSPQDPERTRADIWREAHNDYVDRKRAELIEEIERQLQTKTSIEPEMLAEAMCKLEGKKQ